MALEKTFAQLCDELRQLRDCVQAVQLTAREDAPVEGGVQAVDSFADAVEDAMGWLEESLAAAQTAHRAVAQPVDVESARHALAHTQERFHKVERSFLTELLSYDRQKALSVFAQSRPSEWRGWIKSVRQGLDQCQQPLDQTSKGLLACWQEITERTVAIARVS